MINFKSLVFSVSFKKSTWYPFYTKLRLIEDMKLSELQNDAEFDEETPKLSNGFLNVENKNPAETQNHWNRIRVLAKPKNSSSRYVVGMIIGCIALAKLQKI